MRSQLFFTLSVLLTVIFLIILSYEKNGEDYEQLGDMDKPDTSEYECTNSIVFPEESEAPSSIKYTGARYDRTKIRKDRGLLDY